MPADWVIPLIVANVFGYLLDHSGLGEAVRNRLRPDPVKQAFQHVLTSALTQFEQQHAEWGRIPIRGRLPQEGSAPILAQFLIRDGEPDPSDWLRAGRTRSTFANLSNVPPGYASSSR